MTFYHGTNAELNIGDILIPGIELGVTANHGRSNHVYLTNDEQVGEDIAMREAYKWAATACSVAEDEETDPDPTAYVYIVEPLGGIEPDGCSDGDVGEEAVRTTSAVIVGVVDPYDLYAYRPNYGKHYLF